LSKLCKCGHKMNIRLRTVIYKNSIEIDNVPIYTCETCSKSEVFQPVKSELTELISQFGSNPEKKQFFFNETNELAFLLMTVSQNEYRNTPVDKILEYRINELLDLLLLARSLQDDHWVEDILKRLSQITLQSLNTYDLT
jgi:Fe-S oxidoreductase